MSRDRNQRWTWRLGRFLASVAKKLQYPALATVPVSAAMLSRVSAVSPDQTLEDACQQLVALRVTQMPVIDHGRALGVVTRDAVAHALAEAGPRGTISMAETREVIQVNPSDPAADVLAKLRAHPDAVALVVDHGAPVGLLTVDELANYLSSLDAPV
jgi:predicted transcriptional regulator